MVYGCVRLKIPDIFEIEALAEKVFADGLRPVDLAGYFFLIVTSGIEAGFRIQTAKIGLSADVVPMRMCDEDRGELRQVRRVGPERLVCSLGGVGPGSRVDSDQLPPIVGNDEIVFGKLETGERIDAARNNFGNAARRKSMTRQWVFYKWGDERYRLIKTLVTSLSEIVTGFGLVTIGESEFSQPESPLPAASRSGALWRCSRRTMSNRPVRPASDGRNPGVGIGRRRKSSSRQRSDRRKAAWPGPTLQ